MTVSEALSAPLSRTDSEVLLAFVVQKDRSWVFAHPEYVLTDAEEKQWKALLERRRNGEPVAYLRGVQEFYGRSFMVDAAVLIPRPATEELVRVTLEFLAHPEDRLVCTDTDIVALALKLREFDEIPLIVDIGTGSGCIAITLALECPEKTIIATDVSDTALTVAKRNAKSLGMNDRIEFRKGDGFSTIRDLTIPFLVVSNPPYIPSATELQKDVANFEPHLALFAGDRGLHVLLPLVQAAKEHPFCAGIVVECREDQVGFLHS